MYSRIVVPLDGSPLAEQALEHARELAKFTGAPIHLLRVIDFTRLESYGPYGMAMEYTSFEPILSEEEDASKTYLRRVEAELRESKISVDSEVRRGPVTREIIAASQPGDVIVMASHGRGGITRFLLGSVAEDVIRHSSVPVLLIRASRDESAADPGESAD
jgi:nucleotide-binding universal stress UspA family protein